MQACHERAFQRRPRAPAEFTQPGPDQRWFDLMVPFPKGATFVGITLITLIERDSTRPTCNEFNCAVPRMFYLVIHQTTWKQGQ
jgi:hypothetical protein